MSSFPERVRTARQIGGISARALDWLADLTPGHTSAIETGRRPNVEMKTATAIAGVLGVSLDWLINGEGELPPDADILASVERARDDRPQRNGTED